MKEFDLDLDKIHFNERQHSIFEALLLFTYINVPELAIKFCKLCDLVVDAELT